MQIFENCEHNFCAIVFNAITSNMLNIILNLQIIHFTFEKHLMLIIINILPLLLKSGIDIEFKLVVIPNLCENIQNEPIELLRWSLPQVDSHELLLILLRLLLLILFIVGIKEIHNKMLFKILHTECIPCRDSFSPWHHLLIALFAFVGILKDLLTHIYEGCSFNPIVSFFKLGLDGLNDKAIFGLVDFLSEEDTIAFLHCACQQLVQEFQDAVHHDDVLSHC